MIEKPLYRYSALDSGGLCRLYRQKDVFIPSADDNTKPEDIQRFIDNVLITNCMYVLGRNPKTEAFIFGPSHNSTTFLGHFAVRADKRDGSVVRKTVEAAKWIFKNTTCCSIIAFIRKDNKAARSVLAQIGMTRCGKVKDSVLFNGELHDELIYQGTLADCHRLWPD